MSDSQPSPGASLSELRAEIDRIDGEIHDAILRRAELVGQVRAAKPPGLPAMRPAREAQILRGLLARHHGPFPPRALAQIWQEMIDAFTFLQGGLKVAAPSGTERLARDQYGVLAELVIENDVDRLLSYAAAGKVLAVLPWPEGQDWWIRLATMPDRPVVFAALPFLSGDAGVRAVAVGRAPFEPSGKDRSWIVGPQGQAVPFDPAVPVAQAQGHALFEVHEFIAADDPRLAGFTLLGAFPAPYTLNGPR